MAGLFSMFDVTREGPGVKKDGPQKRSFVVFLEILRRKFWKLLLAGLLFAVVNLPLITRGWADAGLTYITRAFAREKHAFIKDDFFETVRKNRKQAFWVGVINFLVTALLLYNATYYLFGMHPELYAIFGLPADAAPITPTLVDYLVIGCTFAGYIYFTVMKYYIPFMVITFDLSIKQIYRNAFIFSMAGFKQNLIISAILILVHGSFFLLLASVNNVLVYLIAMLVWWLVVPPLRSFLIQYTIFPVVQRMMIDPYYKEHPDADRQLRRDLGLDVEETAEESVAEPVFTDTVPEKPAANAIPRQYTEQELRKFNQKRARTSAEDDDTI